MHFKLLKNKEKLQEKTVLKSQKNNKKTKEKSRGRSMVEMLGVLAIIGVLSIGGIAGYTIAMRRYRANEILNVASKYAMLVWTQINQDALNNPEKYDFGTERFSGAIPSSDCFELDHFCILWGIVNSNTNFSDMGLGGLPFGVNDMKVEYITASKSGLLVSILISVDNKALCETILSQIDYDKEWWSESWNVACSINNAYRMQPYVLSVGFQQN